MITHMTIDMSQSTVSDHYWSVSGNTLTYT